MNCYWNYSEFNMNIINDNNNILGSKKGSFSNDIDVPLTSADKSLNSPHVSSLQQFQGHKNLLNNIIEIPLGP